MKRGTFLPLVGTLAAELLLHVQTSSATAAPVEIALRMRGRELQSPLTIRTLTSQDIHSVNTWERPNGVRSRVRTVADPSGTITLPPRSVNFVEFTIK